MLTTFLNTLRKLFKRKKQFPDITYPITEAFQLNGVTYYTFGLEKDSAFNIPYERALKTVTFYNEMAQRVDDEYLEAHIKACDEVFKSEDISIYRLHQLNQNLKSLREFQLHPDLVYKLASVVYFDDNEDPRSYDHSYNQKKIDIWKKSMPMHDFFYSAPILSLIPFLKDSEINLNEYSKVVALVREDNLAFISRKQ